MTDARMPERWLNDRRLLRLSDAAYRLYIVALLFSVANRTDGELHVDDLRLLPGVDVGRVDELEKHGLWERAGDRWLILDFLPTQTSRDQLQVLENFRRHDREKKARQRARGAVESDVESTAVPGDIPGDVSRDGPRGAQRIGKDRSSLGLKEQELLPVPGDKPTGELPAHVTGHENGTAKAQQRDDLFEAIAEACRIKVDQLTTTSRGALNKARKELAAVDATPDEVHVRARRFRVQYPKASLTASALVKHWPQLQAEERRLVPHEYERMSWTPPAWDATEPKAAYPTW